MVEGGRRRLRARSYWGGGRVVGGGKGGRPRDALRELVSRGGGWLGGVGGSERLERRGRGALRVEAGKEGRPNFSSSSQRRKPEPRVGWVRHAYVKFL